MTGTTNAPPPVTILNTRSPTARPLTPNPVTISASSAAGTRHSVLTKSTSKMTATTTTATTISVVVTSGLLGEGGDEYEPRRGVVDDDDLRVGRDLAVVDVAGEE